MARSQNERPEYLAIRSSKEKNMLASVASIRKTLKTELDERIAEDSHYFLNSEFHISDKIDDHTSALLFIDLSSTHKHLLLKKECQKYNVNQKIFRADESLFSKIRERQSNGRPDLELIDYLHMKNHLFNKYYEINGGFAQLSSSLNQDIVTLSKNKWPSSDIYVRIDPHFLSSNPPLTPVYKHIAFPVNPKWFKATNLHVKERDYGKYILQNEELSEFNINSFYEYRLGGIRSLEFFAHRRQEKYLSMMIEELPREDDPSGIMVGRCIHLDTETPIGTSPDKAVLRHLDLAINVYTGEDRQKRIENNLQNGRSQDATFRTHLFRIENLPLSSVFDFCYMFFESKCLLRELMTGLGVEVSDDLKALKCNLPQLHQSLSDEKP